MEAASKTKGKGLFDVVTDPAKFGTPVYGDPHIAGEREKSLDRILEKEGNDVVDHERRRTGAWNPDLQLVLTARMRDMMDSLNRVPTREEALVDLARKAHPDYTPQQLFDYTRRDAGSDPVLLRRLTGADEQKARRNAAVIKKASLPAGRRAQPPPAPAPQPAPAQPPPPPPPPAPATPPAVITGPTGIMRVPVVEVVYTDQLAVLIQRTDSPLLWEPPLDDSILWGISHGGYAADCVYTGITYDVARSGETHFIFLITEA